MVDFSPYYLHRVPGLKKRGDEYRAPCPVHGGARESFSVDLATGRWRCFSECDEGGDAYRLEERLSGRPFVECKRAVDEACGLEVAVPMAVGRDGTVSPRPSRPSSSSAPATFGRLVATYDYHDALGELVYQVCRYDPKAFSQRRPDPANPGKWIKGLGGVDRLLYRLPEVLREPGIVYLVEGEKDVDLARSWGLNATCNSGGAGKFTPAMARALKGRSVVVLVDNDAPNPKTGKLEGERHAEAVATLCSLEGCSVRLVRFGRDGVGPKDLSEWAALGNDRAKLEGLVDAAPTWGAPLELDREVGPVPDLVVHPRDKQDVVRIVSLCDEQRVPIVPFGAGSGVVLGNRAERGGVALVLRTHMNRLLQVVETDQHIHDMHDNSEVFDHKAETSFKYLQASRPRGGGGRPPRVLTSKAVPFPIPP